MLRDISCISYSKIMMIVKVLNGPGETSQFTQDELNRVN